MKEHIVILNDYIAKTPDGEMPVFGTKHSFGIEQLQIERSEEWTDYEMTVTFNMANGTSEERWLYDDIVDVPATVTSVPGIGHMVFKGVKDGERRISTTLKYRVRDHAGVGGTVPEPPSSMVDSTLLKIKELGMSAYDIAVKNGFEGTEAEWLVSLKADNQVLYIGNGSTTTDETAAISTTIALTEPFELHPAMVFAVNATTDLDFSVQKVSVTYEDETVGEYPVYLYGSKVKPADPVTSGNSVIFVIGEDENGMYFYMLPPAHDVQDMITRLGALEKKTTFDRLTVKQPDSNIENLKVRDGRIDILKESGGYSTVKIVPAEIELRGTTTVEGNTIINGDTDLHGNVVVHGDNINLTITDDARFVVSRDECSMEIYGTATGMNHIHNTGKFQWDSDSSFKLTAPSLTINDESFNPIVAVNGDCYGVKLRASMDNSCGTRNSISIGANDIKICGDVNLFEIDTNCNVSENVPKELLNKIGNTSLQNLLVELLLNNKRKPTTEINSNNITEVTITVPDINSEYEPVMCYAGGRINFDYVEGSNFKVVQYDLSMNEVATHVMKSVDGDSPTPVCNDFLIDEDGYYFVTGTPMFSDSIVRTTFYTGNKMFNDLVGSLNGISYGDNVGDILKRVIEELGNKSDNVSVTNLYTKLAAVESNKVDKSVVDDLTKKIESLQQTVDQLHEFYLDNIEKENEATVVLATSENESNIMANVDGSDIYLKNATVEKTDNGLDVIFEL